MGGETRGGAAYGQILWPDGPMSVFMKARVCQHPPPMPLWRGGAPEHLPAGTALPELSDLPSPWLV